MDDLLTSHVTSKASCVFLKALASEASKKENVLLPQHQKLCCSILIKQNVKHGASFRPSLEKYRIVCEGILATHQNEIDLIKNRL